jgi:2,3-bisphosphoglycerate-independent phosphoglycerate mutase
MIVTADHGNADEMYERSKKGGGFQTNESGSPRAKTSHTLNPVPVYVFAPGVPLAIDPEVGGAGLANLAATVLHLLGYERPDGYLPSILK